MVEISREKKEKLARYPFFKDSREVIKGKSIKELLENPIIERAKDRIKLSVKEGKTGKISENPNIELLSYPAARVLVSTTGNRRLISKYAWAEASTGYKRLNYDIKMDKIDSKDIEDEFSVNIKNHKDSYKIELAGYLKLSPSGEKWKLINREIKNGWIPINNDELLKLSQEGIRQRVIEGLPLDVPSDIKEKLKIDDIQGLIKEDEIEIIEEESFPPCMKEILKEIHKGHPEHHSWFALTSFLSNIGMNEEEILEKFSKNPDFDQEIAKYQIEHIHGDYTCPSCATMKTHGDCRKPDDLCNTIKNPLVYYRKKLEQKKDGDKK